MTLSLRSDVCFETSYFPQRAEFRQHRIIITILFEIPLFSYRLIISYDRTLRAHLKTRGKGPCIRVHRLRGYRQIIYHPGDARR